MNYKNNQLKVIKEKFESQFQHFRKINQEGFENYINKKLGELPIHQLLQQCSLPDFCGIWLLSRYIQVE